MNKKFLAIGKIYWLFVVLFFFTVTMGIVSVTTPYPFFESLFFSVSIWVAAGLELFVVIVGYQTITINEEGITFKAPIKRFTKFINWKEIVSVDVVVMNANAGASFVIICEKEMTNEEKWRASPLKTESGIIRFSKQQKIIDLIKLYYEKDIKIIIYDSKTKKLSDN